MTRYFAVGLEMGCSHSIAGTVDLLSSFTHFQPAVRYCHYAQPLCVLCNCAGRFIVPALCGRFALALALPSLTSSDLANACQGVMSPWLEAMRQLECCKQACPDHKLFQQALRCLPSSSVPQDHYRQNSVWSSAIADSCALQA